MEGKEEGTKRMKRNREEEKGERKRRKKEREGIKLGGKRETDCSISPFPFTLSVLRHNSIPSDLFMCKRKKKKLVCQN